jgi:transposase
MTQDDLSFLPLRVTRVGVGGKRSFDPIDKKRLIDACLQPGTSLSALALKAGVNANQLHKWVRLHEQSNTAAREETHVAASVFVPVVAIPDTPMVTAGAPVSQPCPPSGSLRLSPRVARLSAQLPNGVRLELECGADDSALVRATIAALGAR